MADRRRWLALGALACAWAASRALLILAARHPGYCGAQQNPLGDVVLYQEWANNMAAGRGIPLHDPRWQYPPGAAGVFLLAHALSASYLRGLLVVLLTSDAAVLGVLALRSGPLRWRLAGGWLWVLGPLALGPVMVTRFDVVATAFAVAGLALMGRPVLGGGVLALGGWVKVWPAVVLGAVRDRVGALVALAGVVAASVGVVATLAALGQLGAAASFLGYQQQRGLQVESVAATPFVLAHAWGHGPAASYQYGAFQIGGRGTGLAVTACTLAELLVLLAYAGVTLRAWWRRPAADGAERSLVLVLFLLITSRVLSPQYLVWVLGLAALCLTRRGGRQLPTAILLLLAAGCSQLVYPLYYDDLLAGRVAPTLVLALRNVLVVAAAVVSLWRAVSGARSRTATAAPSTSRPTTSEYSL